MKIYSGRQKKDKWRKEAFPSNLKPFHAFDGEMLDSRATLVWVIGMGSRADDDRNFTKHPQPCIDCRYGGSEGKIYDNKIDVTGLSVSNVCANDRRMVGLGMRRWWMAGDVEVIGESERGRSVEEERSTHR